MIQSLIRPQPIRTPAEAIAARARELERALAESQKENQQLIAKQQVLERIVTFFGVGSDKSDAKVAESFTPKERRIIIMLLQGMRNKEIGEQLGQSEQLVKNCLRFIYMKARCKSRLQLCMMALKSPAFLDVVLKGWKPR